MKPFVFQNYWNREFDNCPPINHFFKHKFQTHWFRLHNLPDAKRYATSETERLEILHRQNTVLHELADDIGTRLFLVTGEHLSKDEPLPELHLAQTNEVLSKYDFDLLDSIDLFDLEPDFINEKLLYRPAFALTEWANEGEHNALLKAIANDELRAFFVLPVGKTIFAPYDGGVDIIIFDDRKRHLLMNKFASWRSQRADGL